MQQLSAPETRRLPLAVVLVAAALLAGCSRAPEASRPPSPPALETLVVTPVDAPREQVWDGVVEALADSTLAAQTNARVVELPVDVGDAVAAGDVLVRFSDVEQRAGQRAARATLAAAEAEAADAGANRERTQEIFSRGLVARAALDAANARDEAARAAVNAARAALASAARQQDYTVLRAPFAGVITRRFVALGEAVQAGPPSPQPLIALAALDALRVDVEVPQGAMPAIRAQREAHVLAPDGTRLAAAQLVIFPWADPASHSFRVRVELPAPPAGLYPGMTVKVAFVTGRAERLLVPRSALVQRGELSAVFVVTDDAVRLRQLRLGHRFGDQVEVLAGLVPGERVARTPGAAARYLQQWRAAGGD